MEKKISTPAEFLCKGFPNELALFINYTKGLKFEERPDYKYLRGLLTQARKANKIEIDGTYDWTSKTTTQNLILDVNEKVEKSEIKVEHVKHKKEEAINQALNSFQLNGVVGGGLLKSGQVSQNGMRKDKDVKEVPKSLNKNGQINSAKNQNNILSSVGLETLVSTKITMPKISVIRK